MKTETETEEPLKGVVIYNKKVEINIPLKEGSEQELLYPSDSWVLLTNPPSEKILRRAVRPFVLYWNGKLPSYLNKYNIKIIKKDVRDEFYAYWRGEGDFHPQFAYTHQNFIRAKLGDEIFYSYLKILNRKQYNFIKYLFEIARCI